jgi:cell division protein FtsW
VIERLDATLMLLWLAVVVVGVVMVASASFPLDAGSGTPAHYVTRHGIYLAGGLVLFGACAVVPLGMWEALHKPLLLIAIVLCALVLVPGIGHVVNGARRWIGMGPFSLQASEATKFLLVVYLAGYLSRQRDALRRDVMALLRPLVLLAGLALMILLEPDFGSVVVLVALTGGLLFIAGARLLHFLAILGVVALALTAVAVLQPYRLERLVTFLNPWASAYGSGYQLTQALIAFGRGEWFGLGLGEGIQKQFYLPEAHNDFIFAVIAEELGLVGAVVVFGMLVALVLRIFRIAGDALASERYFAAYLAYGAGLLIGLQSLINVGVNTGTLPTKGLTLPFVSYGGNSLLVCCALIGLAVRVHIEGEHAR